MTSSGASATPWNCSIASPCRSIPAVSSKHQLHTRGNIDAFARVKGEKKLRLSAAPNAWAAAAEFSSVDFHQKVLLPFYDHS